MSDVGRYGTDGEQWTSGSEGHTSAMERKRPGRGYLGLESDQTD